MIAPGSSAGENEAIDSRGPDLEGEQRARPEPEALFHAFDSDHDFKLGSTWSRVIMIYRSPPYRRRVSSPDAAFSRRTPP